MGEARTGDGRWDRSGGYRTSPIPPDAACAARPQRLVFSLQRVGTGTEKAMTPNEVAKYSSMSSKIDKGYSVAAELVKVIRSGGTLTPLNTNKIAGWLGVKAADVHAQLPALFRELGRAAGVEVGNLALKEGVILVEAGTGRQWDVAPEALRNLILFTDRAKAKMFEQAEGLKDTYDINALVPTLKATEASSRRFRALMTK